MRNLLLALGALCLSAVPSIAGAQDDDGSAARSLERARQDYFKLKGEKDRSPDLWYGIPDVRPGGDLLGPVVELVRSPSGLLDVKPRKVERWLPDRETAEFLRERR